MNYVYTLCNPSKRARVLPPRLLLLVGRRALGRRALREPVLVGAVVVDHVAGLRPPELLLPRGVQLLEHPRAVRPRARRRVRRRAPGRAEPAVRRHEGGPGPVRLDAPALRRPLLGVPHAGVHPHRLARRERHPGGGRGARAEVADGDAVHVEDDVAGVPDHGVGVEVCRGVEPHPELLLAAALPLAVHVGVHRVRLAARVPQELEVDLVVLRPLRREVEGGDGAGGVAGDELELHVEAAVEVLAPGLEARPRGPVHGQRQELAAVEDLAAAVAPGDVHVLVEVAGARDAGEQRRRAQGAEHHQRCSHREPGTRSHRCRHLSIYRLENGDPRSRLRRPRKTIPQLRWIALRWMVWCVTKRRSGRGIYSPPDRNFRSGGWLVGPEREGESIAGGCPCVSWIHHPSHGLRLADVDTAQRIDGTTRLCLPTAVLPGIRFVRTQGLSTVAHQDKITSMLHAQRRGGSERVARRPVTGRPASIPLVYTSCSSASFISRQETKRGMSERRRLASHRVRIAI
jgi:hypothetical protein